MRENGMIKPHWIRFDYSDTYSCSECGVIWELDGGTPKENEMYFCPKCGSKMDDFIEDTQMEIVRS